MVERYFLNDCQAILSRWETDCGLERTTFDRVMRKGEEDLELLEALKKFLLCNSQENREAVANEAMDVIVITLSVIETLGYDAERMFEDIMDTNYEKYNPHRMKELIDSGLEPLEAMSKLKEDWDNGLV